MQDKLQLAFVKNVVSDSDFLKYIFFSFKFTEGLQRGHRGYTPQGGSPCLKISYVIIVCQYWNTIFKVHTLLGFS